MRRPGHGWPPGGGAGPDSTPFEKVYVVIEGHMTVIVAGAEMVPRSAVRQTIERVAETGARVLGIVLNRAGSNGHYYHYYTQ